MEPITFNGEHLLIGNLGHSFVVLSFVSALMAAFFFIVANNRKEEQAGLIGRIGFMIHGVAVLGIIVTLFSIIYNHYFEYYYAWQHASMSLPTHYMISCFWEGQEGSFLLWMFWQVVLGIFLIRRKSEWRYPVMAIVMLAQAVLSSMLLGLELSDSYTFGSSPFQLLREAKPELLELPVMVMRGIPKADYMQIITDGTGLNPLLQNYWMVIHPPTLFFGFATTIVPFAFAIAGLWNRNYTNWMKPALPWALTSVMVLGAGIIMGGIWAYESLSFGGYWAWDPVENASLIPWLMLIAGVHVMIINKSTGQSVVLTYILILMTFILVLYATFLTRSGVLGDSSVHSFTDLGLSRQLLVFLFMFTLLPVMVSFNKASSRYRYAWIFLVLIIVNIALGRFLTFVNGLFILFSLFIVLRNFIRNLPLSKKEESVYSREFWMFVGSLVLMGSALQVLSTTSIPVMNKITASLGGLFEPLYNITHWKLFKTMAEGSLAPPVEPIEHYNRWQLPIAIIIALLSGFVQFFKYRTNKPMEIARKKLILLGVSAVFTALISWGLHLRISGEFMLILLLFAAVFSIIGNLWYIAGVIRFKWTVSGASVAHIGFAMMLVGILISSARKHVISENTRISYGENFSPKDTRENILLMKNQPIVMGDYQVTYVGDSTDGPNTYYQVDYLQPQTGEQFSLYPNAQYNETQGLMPNPDTRHYLLKDVYTHVSSVPEHTEDEDVWEDERVTPMKVGDTIVVGKAIIEFIQVDHVSGASISQDLAGHELEIAMLKVSYGDSSWVAKPLFGVKDGTNSYNIFSFVEKPGIRFNYIPEMKDGEVIHNIETAVKPPRYIIMKAIVFPYINLLWTGTLVMIVGFVMSILRRRKDMKREQA